MDNRDQITNEIVSMIKEAEKHSGENLASMESNEIIQGILRKFELEDDAGMIEEILGADNLHKIRDAENGLY